MNPREELTLSDRRWMEHLRRARDRGVTLVEYAREAGVKVGSLYEARRTLSRKAAARSVATSAVPVSAAEKFVPVHVIAAAPGEVRSAQAVCRLRHPGSGWVIECASWPAASWVAGLAGERR